jgi:zinc protease
VKRSDASGSAPGIDGVVEERLENGLRLLLLESHLSPVVCVSVWYRVGSRHDPAGGAGLAHLLEHMTYNGTARHPKGAYDRVLHAHGALHNASTWLDRTGYYVVVGSDRYEIALDLEADRMRGARLDPADLRDEITVIANEIQRTEDEPAAALHERLQSLAFRVHPYGRPVLGWPEDLQAVTAADLRAFYDRHYQPGNAHLVVVGDVRLPELRERIRSTFGAIPAGAAPPSRAAAEPAQRGERRFELRKAGGQELWAAGYKVPSRSSDDSYALDVLAHVLGHGRTSRLYGALVETGLAVAAGAEYPAAPADPFLFLIDADPGPGVARDAVEEVIDREIDRLAREPVAPAEIARARKRARVEFVMRRDKVSARAFLLGELESTVGWRVAETYLARLDAVTPEHVMRVAGRSLVRDERTVGHFRPSGTD